MTILLSKTKKNLLNLKESLKIWLLIVTLSYGLPVFAQKTASDSIDKYFSQISELLQKSDEYPNEFLDINFLIRSKEKSEGEEKVRLLLQLQTAYFFKSLKAAKTYNDEALRLSKEIGYKEGELRAYYNRAYLLFVKGNFQEALSMAFNIDTMLAYDDYPEVYADVSTLKCDIYTERGQYDIALESGLKLLDVAEKTKNDYLLMKANAALSHYYLRVRNFPQSRSYCLKGLKYIIQLKRTEYLYPKINEIARMTLVIDGPEAALEVYQLFSEVEKNTMPPTDFVKSIKLMILSDIYMAKGELERVEGYLSKAIKMCYKNNYRFRTPRALIQMAELKMKRNDTLAAILNYKKSIEQAEIINAFDVVKSNSGILAKLYEQKKQFSKAYEYNTLNSVIRDSLFNNEKEQRINVLEARRIIKEVTQQKQILELQNEAQRNKYNSITILMVCLLFLSGVATFGYLKVKGKNKLLFQRTIELAEIQLQMQERLNLLQKTSKVSSEENKRHTVLNTGNSVDDEVRNIIMFKLDKLEEEQFFLKSDCSLRQLSSQLKTNPKYLSQVINQEKKSNFNNYINGLRINYLLPKLLKDEEFRNGKLSYIAVSVGYNNQNTFNAAFKKRLGILPSYFISQLNNEYKDSEFKDIQQWFKFDDDLVASPSRIDVK